MTGKSQHYGHLIDGVWTTSSSWSENRNPADLSDLIGLYANGGEEDVTNACLAARRAYSSWSSQTPQYRFEVLDRIGQQLLERRKELGRLLTREEGKTLVEGEAEVARAGFIFKYFAGEALRLAGRYFESVRPGVNVEVSREPLGVVAAITPWNFPMAIPAWKIAPALAYGNCVVLKPASLTPGCAWALAEIAQHVGLPAGVLNLVMGEGSVGEALVRNAEVDALSFTGSTRIGRHIHSRAAERGIPIQLEMGGKNALVVLDDADLDIALRCAIEGAFFSTGQRCTATSRLIVQEGIYDHFVSALSARTAQLIVGNGLEDATHIGPVASTAQLDNNLSYLDIGKKEGCVCSVGGERLKLAQDGYYMSPALLVNSTADMRVNQEEIFGPVATILMASDFEHALAMANNVPYGLVAGIITTSLRSAIEFKRRSQTGMVMVNLPTAGVDYHVPFGGRKFSSYGPREQGTAAREFYTTTKSSYTQC